jgi:hypothetical protein
MPPRLPLDAVLKSLFKEGQMFSTNFTESRCGRARGKNAPERTREMKSNCCEISILAPRQIGESAASIEPTGFQTGLAVVLLPMMLVICGRAAVEHPIRTVLPVAAVLLACLALGLKWAAKAPGQADSAALGSRVATYANTESLAGLPLKTGISVVRVRKAQANWTSVAGQFHFDGHDAA